MKLILILSMVISLYAQDLKQRIEKLTVPPQTKKIVHVKYDPFQKAQVVVSKAIIEMQVEKTLHVTSILNNKVFVNSRWRSVGEEVDGYKIIQIREDSLLAKKSGKVVKFGIKRRDNIVKVKDK
jgi:hypothetical protein